MRATGGTIYTFNSAVEDIGLNINERNNIIKISHFALLDIPQINEPLTSIEENRFNILAIPSAFEYWKTPPSSTKDGRVLIAESFQNYALNFESNLLDSSSYDPTLSKTVSERVFWKWLKETGAIRWANPSNGYWMETTDPDGNAGYNTVVKYLGPVSAGNVRTDSFGTYNETYVLVPTSHGQMEAYFEQAEDSNYYHGIKIGDLGEKILGRESYTKPHPDALSYYGYYDYIDSSTKVWDSGSYNMTVNGVPGGWYSWEGINPPSLVQNFYFTDSSSYLLNGDYDASIRYDNGGDSIEFKRSKVDCMGLVLNLDKLKTIYGDDNLTYDKMAIDYSLAVNDTFYFNTVLIYYTVYNSTQDTALATNLLGVLFLDAPSGNSGDIGFAGITIPSLEKIQSGVGGFGTSYSLRLNIKTDNMVDDTAAPIVDGTTTVTLWESDQWTQAFYELEKAVNILTRNNSVLEYISSQYAGIQSTQNQMLNQIAALQWQVNDITQDIGGTAGAIAMFADGDDPLVDSSIYQKFDKIGFFNNNPDWPIQMDASLKTKDIYIEKAIRDVSGNILISYGSPLQLGSSTNDRSIVVYTDSINTGITAAMDSSIRFFKPVYFDTSLYDKNGNPIGGTGVGVYVKESSLGEGFSWTTTPGKLDISLGDALDGYATEIYVGDRLGEVYAADASIRAEYLPCVSLGPVFVWDSELLDVSISLSFNPDACDNLLIPVSVGGIVQDTSVGGLRGKTYDQMWFNLLFPTVLAYIQTAKSLGISGLSAGVEEPGKSYSPTLLATYTPGLIYNGEGTVGPNLTGDAYYYVFKLPGDAIDYEEAYAGNSRSRVYSTPTVLGAAGNAYTWRVDVSHNAGSGAYHDNKNNPGSNLDGSRVAATIWQVSGTITSRQKRYWGVNASASLSDAQIIALSSEFLTSTPGTYVKSSFILNPTNEYVYYCYPASIAGTPTFWLNSLQITAIHNIGPVTFINSQGYSESYNIYRSDTVQTGTNQTWAVT
jgi:hypothetical protein